VGILLSSRLPAGDVHKDTVVAAVHCVSAPRHQEVRSFPTTTTGPARAGGLARGARLHPRRDGGQGRLLETHLGTCSRPISRWSSPTPSTSTTSPQDRCQWRGVDCRSARARPHPRELRPARANPSPARP